MPGCSGPKHLLDDFPVVFIFAVFKEVFLEGLAANHAFNQRRIQLAQHRFEIRAGELLDFFQNFAVFPLRFCPFARIALAGRFFKELFKNVLEVQIAAPAKAFGKRDGNRISIIDLGKCVGVQRIFNVSAKYARKGVIRQERRCRPAWLPAPFRIR